MAVKGDEYQLLKAYNLILNEDGNKIKYLQPMINFPDYQGRIYKKKENVEWSGKVHERIVGYKKYASFPAEKNYCIFHNKQIAKQERQNTIYDNIVQGKVL